MTADAALLEAALGPVPRSSASPVLVVLSGLPGAGKSYLARGVCCRVAIAHVESDALRRALVARPTYSRQESARLFAACHLLLERLLERRVPVLLDATNLREEHRRPVYKIAERTGARLRVVVVRAPAGVARQRLLARRCGVSMQDRSEADEGVYEQMRATAEPVRRVHLSVNTGGSIAGAVDKIARWIEG